MFKSIPEDPTITSESVPKKILIHTFNISFDNRVTMPFCKFCILGNAFHTNISAIAIYFFVFPCQGTGTTTDLDQYPCVLGYQFKQVWIVSFMRGSLVHRSLNLKCI